MEITILFSPLQAEHILTTLLMAYPPLFPIYGGAGIACIRCDSIAHKLGRLKP